MKDVISNSQVGALKKQQQRRNLALFMETSLKTKITGKPNQYILKNKQKFTFNVFYMRNKY